MKAERNPKNTHMTILKSLRNPDKKPYMKP